MELGAAKEAKAVGGMTPLHQAAVKLLVALGANK